MGCPVSMLGIYFLSGSGVDAFGHLLHGNTIFDRADADTQVAADTFFVSDDKLAFTVNRMGNGLVRGIFTGDEGRDAGESRA